MTGGGGGGGDGGAQTLPQAMTVQDWRHCDAGDGGGGGFDDDGDDDDGGYQRRFLQIHCHRVWVEQRWVQWQQQRERMQLKA